MKKTGFISIKKTGIDINFFFNLLRMKMSTICKRPQLSIFNTIGVICKKLTKTTQIFFKSGYLPLSYFFPRGRGHTKIIFQVKYIYRTRSNSFRLPPPPTRFSNGIKNVFLSLAGGHTFLTDKISNFIFELW